MDDALAHQRRKPDRRPAVVREHQERAGVGDDAAVQRHAVHGRRHAVLAHAVVDEAAGEVGGRDRLHRLGLGVVRAGEVGRAADHLGDRRRSEASSACSDAVRVAISFGSFASFSFTARTAASSAAGRSPRMRRSNSARLSAGSAASRLSQSLRAGLERWPAARHAVRMSVGTWNGASLQPSFSRAPLISSAPSGEPWRLLGAGLGRRAEADGGLAGDQRRPVGGFRLLDRRRDRLGIVAVDPRRGPAGGLEALDLIDRVRERQRAVDRDAVVVEQHDQLAELEVTGERDRLLADAFHQVAVGGEHVGGVVDDVLAEHAPPDGARRSPCRPRWRGPGRAGRWWSRRPA